MPFDRDTGVSHHDGDTVGFEVWPEGGSDLWLLETKERSSSFNEGHFRAEPCERLPQLDANGTRSEYR